MVKRIAVALIASVIASGTLQAQTPSVALTVTCTDPQHFTATLRNVSNANTSIVLGLIVFAGKFFSGDVSFDLTRPGSDDADRYLWLRRDSPAARPNTITDWIVPLPVGAAYSLTLEPGDFVKWPAALDESRLLTLPDSSRLTVRVGLRDYGHVSAEMMTLFPVWAGEGSLASNTIRTPQDCHP